MSYCKLCSKNKLTGLIFGENFSYGIVGQQQLQLDYPSLALSNWYRRLENRYQQQALTPEARQKLMLSNNPALILRNHLLQDAIEHAKIGDYSEMSRLFDALSDPYVESDICQKYYKPAPRDAAEIILSCSS